MAFKSALESALRQRGGRLGFGSHVRDGFLDQARAVVALLGHHLLKLTALPRERLLAWAHKSIVLVVLCSARSLNGKRETGLKSALSQRPRGTDGGTEG